MAAGSCLLPAVGPFARDDGHPIIIRSADDISRDFRQGSRGGIVTFATDEAPILITLDPKGIIEGDEQSGELQGYIGTDLVVTLTRLVAYGEVIGAMQVDIEFLGCAEGVTLGETHLQHRTIASIGASDGVTLDIEVIGLVEGTVQSEVQRVCTRTGRKAEVSAAEDTVGVDE